MINSKPNISFIKVISVILVAQLLLFKIATTLTLHVHQLPDGRVITHSHFVIPESGGEAGNPAKKHHHSELELLLLHLFTVTDFAALILFILIFSLSIIQNRYNSLREISLIYSSYSIPSLRAPPVLS